MPSYEAANTASASAWRSCPLPLALRPMSSRHVITDRQGRLHELRWTRPCIVRATPAELPHPFPHQRSGMNRIRQGRTGTAAGPTPDEQGWSGMSSDKRGRWSPHFKTGLACLVCAGWFDSIPSPPLFPRIIDVPSRRHLPVTPLSARLPRSIERHAGPGESNLPKVGSVPIFRERRSSGVGDGAAGREFVSLHADQFGGSSLLRSPDEYRRRRRAIRGRRHVGPALERPDARGEPSGDLFH